MSFLKKKQFVPYKREIFTCVAVAASLFLTIALFTFNANDPSLFYYQTNDVAVANKCGFFGAQCAALLIHFLGAASLLVPFFLLFCVWLTAVHGVYRYEWDRCIASVVAVPVVASLATLYRLRLFKGAAPGGVLGQLGLKLSCHFFDYVGSFIVLHTILLVCAILMFRISPIGFLRRTFFVVRFLVRNRDRYASAFRTVVAACARPFVYAYRWVRSLLEAHDVDESGESIVLFEGSVFGDLKDVGPREFVIKAEQSSPAPVVHEQYASVTEMNSSDVSVDEEPAVTYKVPEEGLFESRDQKGADKKTSDELKERAKILEAKLERFGVSGEVTSIRPGPVVTLFEYEPHVDIKISKIIGLEDDLALALQALSIRIIAPIPGKSVVGFEVANQVRKSVYFSAIVQSKEYKQFSGALPLVLGDDTVGSSVVVDLVKMPHLLVAGSTGSGKSVALNTMLISLLCHKSPDELKLILIDPKRLEFAGYADIAHLLFPLVTDPRKAVPVLKWVVQTMEERYERMAQAGARTIADFNMAVEVQARMPYIVVVIDELADLMMTAGNDVENLLMRLSQMARASGIHLIIATQRPSVDVVTGLIKVNFPSRISFKVTSKVDSRTILDTAGAERLLGKGDMLFLDAASSNLVRVHGAYVSDKEIAAVITHIKAQRPPAYLNIEEELAHGQGVLLDADDELYQSILSYLQEVDEISISMLQRRFRIGFNRSARIIEALESQGKIMPADGAKARKVIRS